SCLLFLTTISAQTFSGTLFMRDKSSFYLNQIYVTNLNEQRTYLTSYTGEFKIPAKVGDVIRFTSIVSERKDIKITPQLLENPRNLIELEVAYREIQEVILSRFKPTGNLRKDVRTLDSGHLQVKVNQPHSDEQPAISFNTPVKKIINVGSVGEPRHGRPNATYVVYDTETEAVSLREVEYDYQKTCAAILDAGLPPIFAWRLARGLEFAEKADDPTHVCER
ncbi:MAG: hypothetical protein RLZZ04_3459, partial [Cyanobacteriota bacterium]